MMENTNNPNIRGVKIEAPVFTIIKLKVSISATANYDKIKRVPYNGSKIVNLRTVTNTQ